MKNAGRPSYVSDQAIADFISIAFKEDGAYSDHSTLGAIPASLACTAQLLVKDDGILAGAILASSIFRSFDPDLQLERQKNDGDHVKPGDIAFFVSGRARSILSTERIVLNCMQRMSGIATYAHHLCKLIEGTGAKLMDTRKTTPGFRMLEKWAVSIGGGLNHRFALSDMVMLKDNHVDMAGGIRNAIKTTASYLSDLQRPVKIEVETRTLDEVRAVLDTGGVEVIMLDNMDLATMRSAVSLISKKYKTEASGGITETNIRAIAECGVDYISIGALTHSVKSLDLSLKVLKPNGSAAN